MHVCECLIVCVYVWGGHSVRAGHSKKCGRPLVLRRTDFPEPHCSSEIGGRAWPVSARPAVFLRPGTYERRPCRHRHGSYSSVCFGRNDETPLKTRTALKMEVRLLHSDGGRVPPSHQNRGWWVWLMCVPNHSGVVPCATTRIFGSTSSRLDSVSSWSFHQTLMF